MTGKPLTGGGGCGWAQLLKEKPSSKNAIHPTPNTKNNAKKIDPKNFNMKNMFFDFPRFVPRLFLFCDLPNYLSSIARSLLEFLRCFLIFLDLEIRKVVSEKGCSAYYKPITKFSANDWVIPELPRESRQARLVKRILTRTWIYNKKQQKNKQNHGSRDRNTCHSKEKHNDNLR